jgi:hypothetical protein
VRAPFHAAIVFPASVDKYPGPVDQLDKPARDPIFCSTLDILQAFMEFLLFILYDLD